jgi:rubrerythrin
MTKKAAHDKTTIRTREELIYALCEAAEIEHGLTCVYLFTAFSMKKFLYEEIDEVQQDKIRNWASVILRVAHQEMEHLGLVCNMLNAIGGAQHFARPNLPQPKEYYQTAVDLNLSKFSLATMADFMAFEKPDIADKDKYKVQFDQIVPVPVVIHNGHVVQELYEAILNGFIYLDDNIELFIGNEKSQVVDKDIDVGFNNKEYGVTMLKVTNLEQAKAAIREIIEQGEGVILQGDAVHLDNKKLTLLYEKFDHQVNLLNAYVLDQINWPAAVKQAAKSGKELAALIKKALPLLKAYPQHVAIAEKAMLEIAELSGKLADVAQAAYSPELAAQASALRDAISSAAVNNAEGAILYSVVVEKDCHYLKFWQVYQDLKAELAQAPDFEPARNVADNPMLRRHSDTLQAKNINIVEYDYTRRVLELFNAGYETMVDMLILFFSNDKISKHERKILMNTAFFPFMTMFIRPFGEILTMLPLKDHPQAPLQALRAGGSFEYYINIALMPRTQPKWLYLEERLQQIVDLSSSLQAPDEHLRPYFAPEGFDYLCQQMGFFHRNDAERLSP